MASGHSIADLVRRLEAPGTREARTLSKVADGLLRAARGRNRRHDLRADQGVAEDSRTSNRSSEGPAAAR